MLKMKSEAGKTSVPRKLARQSALFIAMVGFLVATTSAADSGQSAFKQARLLEQAQEYEAA